MNISNICLSAFFPRFPRDPALVLGITGKTGEFGVVLMKNAHTHKALERIQTHVHVNQDHTYHVVATMAAAFCSITVACDIF
jgi:uncharacterized membrane protein YgdD (TMEM256/DUF423 family)